MKKLLAYILLTVICLFSPHIVQAKETIKSFDTKIVAHQNGEMTITETIKYDFGSSSRHGIFRFIPTFTPVGNLYRISDFKFISIKRDGKNEKHSDSYQADQVEVKIGDPDQTIKFEHTYEIVYQVKNGIGSNYDDHDEIYWNLTGLKWDVPIEMATGTVTTDFDAVPTKTSCFTGPQGATTKDCQSEIAGNVSLTKTTQNLDPSAGLTVVTAFPVGTFPKSQLSDQPPTIGKDLQTVLVIYGSIWLILNTFVVALVIRWYQKNRNKSSFGKPAVNFDIPKVNGQVVTPLEAGIIDNTKLEQNDVMATIFDLAIKKYIKIKQLPGKTTLGVFKGQDDYEVIKLKEYENDDSLTEGEKILLEKLLAGQNTRKLSDIKTFYQTFTRLETSSFALLKKRNFYNKNPKTQKAFFRVFGIVSLVSLQIILGPVLLFLSTRLNGRTEKGDRLDWELEGLKIFLKNMKRHYNFQVKNAITVEKYIPYAMAFGFIDEFMNQIKEIYPDYNPSWYSGNNSFYAARMGIVSSMNSHFTTSAPSSSSGFSGGGSSGGGGGGGGGGSW